MVANISYADAESMLDDLKEIRGVQSISFDDTTDHYNNASALFSITSAVMPGLVLAVLGGICTKKIIHTR